MMTRLTAVLIAIYGFLFSTSTYSSPAENKSEPIRIITNNWTSQIVLSHVTGQLFQKMGYQLEYISLPIADQWGALAHGLAHVQIEVWEGTMSEIFNRMVNEGHILDAGTHDAKTREEWWYPDYVEELCPGLPDYKALAKCAHIFATPYSSPSGTYFAGPWEKPHLALIRALGLDFKVKVLPKGDDLWVELEKAASVKRPIVLFNWTPNWVESAYQGSFVEFPDFDPACETDPSWGINPEFTYDCGNPKDGWLKKAAWIDMEKSFPCAYQTLKNINFTNLQIAEASLLVDVEKQTTEKAATQWLNNNEKVWREWIPSSCQP